MAYLKFLSLFPEAEQYFLFRLFRAELKYFYRPLRRTPWFGGCSSTAPSDTERNMRQCIGKQALITFQFFCVFPEYYPVTDCWYLRI